MQNWEKEKLNNRQWPLELTAKQHNQFDLNLAKQQSSLAGNYKGYCGMT